MFSWPRSSRRTQDTKLLNPGASYGSTCSQSSTDSGSETDAEQDEVELGFSFSGGGWLMIYMFGVATGLREVGVHRNARFIGSSSGALTAMGLHLDSDFDAVADVAISQYVPVARASVRGAFRMREYVHRALLAVKGVEFWAKTKTHPRTCQVVYTSLSAMKSKRKSTFKSQDDLVNGLLASCTATPIAGFPFKYDGEWVADGGFTDNQPLFTEEDGVRRTVTVTPNVFDESADIKPSKYIPPWWSVYPPTQDDMRWLYRLGYEDGLSWCKRNGYASSTAASSTSSAEDPWCNVAQFETVLGQVTGYAFFEKLGKFFSIKDKHSIYALFKLELTLRRTVEIGFASLDSVMFMWTAIVAGALAFLLASGSVETSDVVCWIISIVYLAVDFVRVYRKTQEINQTPTWQNIMSSLQQVEDMRTTTGGSGAHGIKALRVFHDQLAHHHHDVLVEYSLLYRISTLL